MPISTSKNKTIGITVGDPSGIGPEVTAKALNRVAIHRLANFKIIGDQQVFQQYFPRCRKNCSFVDAKPLYQNRRPDGKMTRYSGLAALSYLHKAVNLLKEREITALVTAPVCKEAIHHVAPSFQGHTEFLAENFSINYPGMMFVNDQLKMVVVTRHIPLANVSRAITSQNVYETIRMTHKALKNLFGIDRPKIGVCGLNPHAGEGGGMGREEQTKIIPALKKAQKNKMIVEGPFAADTLFIPSLSRKYDAIVAMYHDQGLIPVKALYFSQAVNLTIGLPFIRTSPAHGTAFDIAGKNKADPSSMSEAIKLAAQLSL